jgi:alpha-amylase
VSNTHPWFQNALQGPEAEYYDWFVWSDRIVHEEGPWGQTVWHTPDGGKTYYFAIFNFLIPDLNYRNPAVTEEILEVSRYWLEDIGVDGFRIDASRHLLENETDTMDLPETFQWYRDHYFPCTRASTPINTS